MNFTQVTITEEAGKFYAILDGLKIAIPSEKTKNLSNYIGNAVGLGIRSEHIALATAGDSEAIKIKVKVVEHMGNEALIYFHLQETLFVMRTADLATVPKIGEECFIKLDSSKIYFFDLSNELNIAYINEANLQAPHDLTLSEIEAVIGGIANLAEVEACISRLRLVLNDESKVDKKLLEKLGLKFLLLGDNKCHLLLGQKSEAFSKELKKALV